MKKTVDVVIPSYKPDHKFDRLMHMLQKQTYPIGTILIVNTEEKFFPEKGYETWQNVQIRHRQKILTTAVPGMVPPPCLTGI